MSGSGTATVTIKLLSGTQCNLPTDLLEFYSLPHNLRVLRMVNSSSPPLSLRTIAYFMAVGADEGVRRDYESQLRRLTRRRFDPFRRCDRVLLDVDGETVVTTEGQMNFFRWFIDTGMWKFVNDNRSNVISVVARASMKGELPTGGAAEKCASKGSDKSLLRPFQPSRCKDHGLTILCGRHVMVFD